MPQATDPAAAYEKLGAFYLGRVYDPDRGAATDDPLLYDAKDLTTHAVCVGMTGSGKTGLCISLLEEAAIDGVPALAVDPKGDLGNLLLTFPDLRPTDFEPWVDPGEASRAGQTPGEYAAATAERWRRGLADWGQAPARIQRLREAADFAIYTPGSSAGLPVTALRSFGAPPPAILRDGDALRERVTASASGLLALTGLEADPITSREHILLATLLERAWRDGKDLDIAAIIAGVQSPPFERIGVMDLESFFPAKDRNALALKLNSLLASPAFAGWLEGEPLDPQRLLWTPEGKPRIAVLSIAHLSDAERMFFVTLLLGELVAWMRAQSGTSSLRALFYMDEVFGFFPPTANPPAKEPMLTLLKQARAFGLGVVLATQNPVDLDYKGLSNAGTWFLGRLQTERDKARVMDGLEGASAAAGAAFDRARVDRILSGLSSRVFLMNNVHEDAPILFHTRWAMSYLRGPLTRAQIQHLVAPAKADAQSVAAAVAAPSPGAGAPTPGGARPAVAAEIPERFATPEAAAYRPALLGTADLHYANARAGLDVWETVACLAPLEGKAAGDVWKEAEHLRAEPASGDEPAEGASFTELPAAAARPASYTKWERMFETHLYRDHALTLFRCKSPKLESETGETEAAFRIRVREAARAQRDEAMEQLRQRYTPKLARLEKRLRSAQEAESREEAQYSNQKMQTAISAGATVLGALFGRKVGSVGTVGRATTAMRGASRAARERGDVQRAREKVAELQQELHALEATFEDELAKVRDAGGGAEAGIESVAVRPRKSDIVVGKVVLLWR